MSYIDKRIGTRIKSRREQLGMSQTELANKVGLTSRSGICKIESGERDIAQSKLPLYAKALDCTVFWILGVDDYAPDITEDYITFPVLGEVACGYEHIAIEEWSGDKIDIPTSYLKGHSRNDFFVLKVVGDSMIPHYLAGDKILVLKQSTMDYSGQIGVVVYGDECATLKRVVYVMGEDWMELQPLNMAYSTIRIENEALEHCKVLGIPKLLIREV